MTGEESGNNQEIETQARELGWRPKEEFQGDPDRWVDADEFLERGQQIMPILKKNNQRLQQELLTRDREIGMLKTAVKNSERAIEVLGKQFQEATKREVAAARQELRQRIAEARETGDIDAELAAQDQLGELRDAEKAQQKKDDAGSDSSTKADSPPANKGNENLDPAFVAWQEAHPWFGKDIKKTKLFIRTGEDLRDEGYTGTGEEFFEEVEKRVNEHLKDDRPGGKVEGGNHGSGGGKGKGFRSLPKEAQEACMRFADDLVGPDKQYKTIEDWQAAYAKDYLEKE